MNDHMKHQALPQFLNNLLNLLVTGTIATLPNHGVAQTLKISLIGSNAFVTA